MPLNRCMYLLDILRCRIWDDFVVLKGAQLLARCREPRIVPSLRMRLQLLDVILGYWALLNGTTQPDGTGCPPRRLVIETARHSVCVEEAAIVFVPIPRLAFTFQPFIVAIDFHPFGGYGF